MHITLTYLYYIEITRKKRILKCTVSTICRVQPLKEKDIMKRNPPAETFKAFTPKLTVKIRC